MKREIFKEAITSIKNNRLRSILTISIISIGITALVGSMTTTDALIDNISKSFSDLGINNITIRENKISSTSLSHECPIRNNSKINYYQTESFSKLIISEKEKNYSTNYSVYCEFRKGIKTYYGNKIIDNCNIIGSDGNFLKYKSLKLSKGRNFYPTENVSNSNICIVGNNISKSSGDYIRIHSIRYQIIGCLAKSQKENKIAINNSIIIPLKCAKEQFESINCSYEIGVFPNQKVAKNNTSVYSYAFAEKLFRIIRRLKPKEINDFELSENSATQNEIGSLYSLINNAAKIICFITLLGASICLINIMLVSVKERTKEIGTRKALGAKNIYIRIQFLTEALLIGQIGGTFGIFGGLLVGNICAYYLDTNFVIPWGIIITAITTCIIVSLISGYLPARKAANLNPITALHYE
ncbi:MAG: FtsX-like permease family protein [Bacteroidales bacterium]